MKGDEPIKSAENSHEHYEWIQEVQMGSVRLNNRICMAALTRMRCDPQDGIPNDLLVEYYSQRSGAGMILTEATAWNQRGECFPGAACLYNEEHQKGWVKVLEAVHSKGAKMFLQIFHGGRACVPTSTRGLQPWAPSQIAIRDKHRMTNSDSPTPKAMTVQEINSTKQDFDKSVKLAKSAGFDGIQLHGAHGYLIDEFLRTSSNRRTDEYGGSPENRCRFALELVDIALQSFAPDRIGIKITPVSRLNDMYDEDPESTYGYLLKELNHRKIGFVEIRESNQVYAGQQTFPKSSQEQMPNVSKVLKSYFDGIVIANQQFNEKSGLQKIQSGDCQMISFGRLYIANPDLAQRIAKKQKINQNGDGKTFFGHQNGAKGYTDYQKI